jgi:hypothetical protein
MHHDLNVFTKEFQPIVDCKKRAIVVVHDRDYKIDDSLTLLEPSGRSITVNISYLDDFGCQHGYVNLSLCKVGLLIVGNTESK